MAAKGIAESSQIQQSQESSFEPKASEKELRLSRSAEDSISRGELAQSCNPHAKFLSSSSSTYISFSDIDTSDSDSDFPSNSLSSSPESSPSSFVRRKLSIVNLAPPSKTLLKPLRDLADDFHSLEALSSTPSKETRLETFQNRSYLCLMNHLDTNNDRTTSNLNKRDIKYGEQLHLNPQELSTHLDHIRPNNAAVFDILEKTLKEDPIVPAENLAHIREKYDYNKKFIENSSPEEIYKQVTDGMSEGRKQVFNILLKKILETGGKVPKHVVQALLFSLGPYIPERFASNTMQEKMNTQIMRKLLEHAATL